MRRNALLTPLTLLLLGSASALGDERNRFADVLALQEAVHQAIERAEPSIACILVSRSDKYRAYDTILPRQPGQLGRFDARSALRSVDKDSPESQAIQRLDLSNPDNVPEAYGSGIVLDSEKGLILTLAHVIRNATKIYVRLPGGIGSWADIHASDPRSDLAVLRLIERKPNLKTLKLGDGSKLRKGDFILSLSNPFAAGFRDGSPSSSWGIVSNLRRRATGVLTDDVSTTERNAKLPLYCFNTLIQTDTRMNLGCSGGALLNLEGELVGLTSSLAGIAGGETPGGFGVPLDDGMRRIINVLLRGEEVEYGFLGVYLERADQILEGYVRISSLVDKGPAVQGGIRGPIYRGGFPMRNRFRSEPGDYILSINGTPIHNNDDLFLAVGLQQAGTTIRVEVSQSPVRPGQGQIHQVKLTKFPSVPSPSLGPLIASNRPRARGGLRVDWSSVVLPLEQFIPEGVVIREVLPGSAAEKARLRPDLIIKKVNGQEISTPAEFYREMEKANGLVEITYDTLRGGNESRVTIKVN
ncbi:MAG TPA: trypsin-like peptidase domain-containing protein [Gemmataceae bacterium]|nr:trypsin-like peptidase domain-containing protein [Gemmataceae bacterium]